MDCVVPVGNEVGEGGESFLWGRGFCCRQAGCHDGLIDCAVPGLFLKSDRRSGSSRRKLGMDRVSGIAGYNEGSRGSRCGKWIGGISEAVIKLVDLVAG